MYDYVIFKFTRIDKNILKSLVNSELYFARPARLNDPFDCRVDILASLENAILRATGPARNKLKQLREDINIGKIKTDLENFGVCSFSGSDKSKPLMNTLMWSHYADHHRGICLTYALPKSFFDATAQEILGIVKVDYGLNPLSDWFSQEALKPSALKDFILFLIKKALTVKAESWEYEEEVRILRQNEGVQVIDKQYLKQICFGLATPDSDIKLLKNIIRQCGYKVDLCRMIRSTSSDFGLEQIEI
jgi:hypothetical protein